MPVGTLAWLVVTRSPFPRCAITLCPAEFLPVTTFYISYTNADRNLRTSLKDAETFRVSLRALSFKCLCEISKNFPRSTVSRQMDWERRSYRMASKVTRIDPFRFLPMGEHKGVGAQSEGARCGPTASLNNCSM